MSGWARVAGLFLAPAEGDPPAPPSRPAVAVLAAPEAAVAAGSAVALALGTAIVAVWGASLPPFAAGPRARRLATRLTDRGHTAVPAGRLVRVELEDPAEVARVESAAQIPAVLVVAGPRDDAVDRVLLAHDLVLVAGGGLLADLATRSIATLGVPTETLTLPDAPAARLLATTGLALVNPWRRTLADLLTA